MKKITVTLFLFLTLISGCGGNEKPNGLSDEMYESAIYAIKAVDLYLDAESTIEETKEKLDSILPEYESIDEGDSYVWSLINGLSIDALGIGYRKK